MSWQKVRFGDYTEIINGGVWNQSEYTSSGIPVVKVTNLVNGSVDTSDLSFISHSSYAKYARNLLKKDDLAVTTVGSHPNQVASADGRAIIIPSKADGFLLNQNAVCIRTCSCMLDQKFLGYTGKSLAFQSYIKSVARGAANQVRIALSLIKEFELPLPPLEVQQSIADILSAYDDLIENNLRRIQLLEEAARCRYKLLMESCTETEKVNLKTVAEVNSETLKSRFNGQILYIDIASVGVGSINEKTSYDFKDAPGRARRIVRHGDTIWSCVRPNRKSYSIIWQPEDNLIASTGFAVIRPKQYPALLYHALTTNEYTKYLESQATGAAYPAVTAKDFESSFLTIPSDRSSIEDFETSVEPMFTLSKKLSEQNVLLREARDILLPRLMSGEIDVSTIASPNETILEMEAV